MGDSEAAAGGLPILSVQGSGGERCCLWRNPGHAQVHPAFRTTREYRRGSTHILQSLPRRRPCSHPAQCREQGTGLPHPLLHVCTDPAARAAGPGEHDLHALRGLIQRVANSAFYLAAARTQNHIQRSDVALVTLPDTIQDVCALVDRFPGVEGQAFRVRDGNRERFGPESPLSNDLKQDGSTNRDC